MMNKNYISNKMIHKIIVYLLSIIIIILPKFNKFNVALLFDNMFLKILFITLVLFSILENYLVGILMTIIFFYINLINNNQINEGFLNYYKKKI